MKYTIFEDKEIHKWNKELLQLHQRCCKTYLIQRSLKHTRIKQFFIIYNTYINEKNIREYFFTPIKLFIQAMVLDQLNKIRTNYDPKRDKKAKRKKTKRNKS